MRIVIKAGSEMLVKEGRLNKTIVQPLVEQMARLIQEGHQVVFVTSGAVAYGQKPNQEADIISKSRAAMRGQPRLMKRYSRLFGEFGVEVAQALYTYTNLRENAEFIATNLLRGFRDKEITIINFQDACADAELIALGASGDNDILAAMVTNLIKADLLVILTNVSGLLDGNNLISEVKVVTPEILEMAYSDGMRKKLKAAQMVQEEGQACIIASGSEGEVITRIVEKKERIGTCFWPKGKTTI